jgi:hypothetical protein
MAVGIPKPDTFRWKVLEALVRNEEGTSTEVTSWVLPGPARLTPYGSATEWRQWRAFVTAEKAKSRTKVSRALGRLQERGLIARTGPAELHAWALKALRKGGVAAILRHIHEVGFTDSEVDLDDPDSVPGVEDVPGVDRSAAQRIVEALAAGPKSRTMLYRESTGKWGAPTGAWLRVYSRLCERDVICAPAVRRPTTEGRKLIKDAEKAGEEG